MLVFQNVELSLQRGDLESGNEMDVLPIKEEGTEEDTWNSGHQGQSESKLGCFVPPSFPFIQSSHMLMMRIRYTNLITIR